MDIRGVTHLPRKSRILRHVPNGKYQDGKVDGSVFVPAQVNGEVFQLREFADGPETGLSVASLDLLDGTDEDRLGCIRATFPKTLKPAQRFAELTVDSAASLILEHLAHHQEVAQLASLSLIHTPVEATQDRQEFFSHCDVMGLPLRSSAFSDMVGEVISYAVTALHPAVHVEPEAAST